MPDYLNIDMSWPVRICVQMFFLWLPFSAKAVSIYRLTGRRELIKRVGLNSAIIHIMGFELITGTFSKDFFSQVAVK